MTDLFRYAPAAACGLINLDIEMVVVLVGVERSYFLIGPIPKIRIPL